MAAHALCPRGRHYKNWGKGKPLEILGEIPGVSQIYSPTRNRTVSDTWLEVRVALHPRAGAWSDDPGGSMAAFGWVRASAEL